MTNPQSQPFTLEELNHAFNRAEEETARHFEGHTCSMTNKNGDDECPICFFRRRVKHILGADWRWENEHRNEG